MQNEITNYSDTRILYASRSNSLHSGSSFCENKLEHARRTASLKHGMLQIPFCGEPVCCLSSGSSNKQCFRTKNVCKLQDVRLCLNFTQDTIELPGNSSQMLLLSKCLLQDCRFPQRMRLNDSPLPSKIRFEKRVLHDSCPCNTSI